MEELQAYDFKVIHRPGSQNKNADALSRSTHMPPPTEEEIAEQEEYINNVSSDIIAEVGEALSRNNLYRQQLNDATLVELRQWITEKKLPPKVELKGKNADLQIYAQLFETLYVENDGLLVQKVNTHFGKRSRILVPKLLQESVFLTAHNETAGHFGIQPTMKRMKMHFFYPNMMQDISVRIEACARCLAKTNKVLIKAGVHVPMRNGFPMQTVNIDLMGLLPVTPKGHKYIMVMQDGFSRFVVLQPLKSKDPEEVAEVLCEHFIKNFGCPMNIHTDRGKEFDAEIMKLILERFQITHTMSPPRNPQSNPAERFNRTLNAMLRALMDREELCWDEFLPAVSLAYNTKVQESTQVTPFLAFMGREANLPLDLYVRLPDDSDPNNEELKIRDLIEKYRAIHDFVREKQEIVIKRNSRLYLGKSEFEEGQLVWYLYHKRLKNKIPKHTNNWIGPFEVIEKISKVIYKIRPAHNAHGKEFTVHVGRMKLFKSDPKEWNNIPEDLLLDDTLDEGENIELPGGEDPIVSHSGSEGSSSDKNAPKKVNPIRREERGKTEKEEGEKKGNNSQKYRYRNNKNNAKSSIMSGNNETNFKDFSLTKKAANPQELPPLPQQGYGNPSMQSKNDTYSRNKDSGLVKRERQIFRGENLDFHPSHAGGKEEKPQKPSFFQELKYYRSRSKASLNKNLTKEGSQFFRVTIMREARDTDKNWSPTSRVPTPPPRRSMRILAASLLEKNLEQEVIQRKLEKEREKYKALRDFVTWRTPQVRVQRYHRSRSPRKRKSYNPCETDSDPHPSEATTPSESVHAPGSIGEELMELARELNIDIVEPMEHDQAQGTAEAAAIAAEKEQRAKDRREAGPSGINAMSNTPTRREVIDNYFTALPTLTEEDTEMLTEETVAPGMDSPPNEFLPASELSPAEGGDLGELERMAWRLIPIDFGDFDGTGTAGTGTAATEVDSGMVDPYDVDYEECPEGKVKKAKKEAEYQEWLPPCFPSLSCRSAMVDAESGHLICESLDCGNCLHLCTLCEGEVQPMTRKELWDHLGCQHNAAQLIRQLQEGQGGALQGPATQVQDQRIKEALKVIRQGEENLVRSHSYHELLSQKLHLEAERNAALNQLMTEILCNRDEPIPDGLLIHNDGEEEAAGDARRRFINQEHVIQLRQVARELQATLSTASSPPVSPPRATTPIPVLTPPAAQLNLLQPVPTTNPILPQSPTAGAETVPMMSPEYKIDSAPSMESGEVRDSGREERGSRVRSVGGDGVEAEGQWESQESRQRVLEARHHRMQELVRAERSRRAQLRQIRSQAERDEEVRAQREERRAFQQDVRRELGDAPEASQERVIDDAYYNKVPEYRIRYSVPPPNVPACRRYFNQQRELDINEDPTVRRMARTARMPPLNPQTNRADRGAEIAPLFLPTRAVVRENEALSAFTPVSEIREVVELGLLYAETLPLLDRGEGPNELSYALVVVAHRDITLQPFEERHHPIGLTIRVPDRKAYMFSQHKDLIERCISLVPAVCHAGDSDVLLTIKNQRRHEAVIPKGTRVAVVSAFSPEPIMITTSDRDTTASTVRRNVAAPPGIADEAAVAAIPMDRQVTFVPRYARGHRRGASPMLHDILRRRPETPERAVRLEPAETAERAVLTTDRRPATK